MSYEKARERDQRMLKQIQKNIRGAHEYFIKNVNRYHDFRKFVFQSSLTGDDETKLNILQKPVLEFNILEAYVSRLRGEFSKHEPSITVRAADGVRVEELTPDFLKTMDVIEAHLREIFFDATNDSLKNKIYSDILGGGFSVVSIYTDYVNEMSFEQNICIERVFDPTLTGFDPLARMSHKGDGEFCFQIYPKTRETFEAEYGKEATKNMKFSRTAGNYQTFNWSYINQEQEILLIVDYYCKVKKKEKLVKLSNGHCILKKHYERFIALWESQGFIEQAPIIIEERETVIESIERYHVCEDKILLHETTSYKYLPLIFIDGNSMEIRESESGASSQMTRPFVYHAKGIQQLKNFAGQTVASNIENIVQHKFIVAAEAIPEDYMDAYKNVQQASTLVYNAFYKDDPATPLPQPREVQVMATPPIVENTFMGTDQVTQTILGTYDSVLATNDKQISGVAIQQGGLQTNAAAIPYLIGFINGLNRIAQVMIDLIPKYYVTPRSLPIRHEDGKRSFQIINYPDNEHSIYVKYDSNKLQVKVEAGVSSGVQKQVALDQIIRMMQSSELFAQFINTKGLETILDNLDIRGIEGMKQQAVQYMQELQEQQKQAMEMQANQPDPQMAQIKAVTEIEMAKVEQQAVKNQGDQAIQAAKVANEKQLTDIKFIETMARIQREDAEVDLKAQEIDSENARSAVEAAMAITQNIHQMERGG